MGWSIGYDNFWRRDIGYGVPAVCDHPDCNADIDRGLSYVCGGEPYGGEHGCGLYFCGEHLERHVRGGNLCWLCPRCGKGEESFPKKPDTVEWIRWKLNHESWAEWREENPEAVEELEKSLMEEK